MYADIFAANIDKSFLDANNIESMITADECGGMSPHMTITAGVRLIVREEDASKAISILNEPHPEFDDAPDIHGKKSNSNTSAEDSDEEEITENAETGNPAICPKCSYDNSMEMRENVNWNKCRRCNTPLK
jgi:hypothetical protein